MPERMSFARGGTVALHGRDYEPCQAGLAPESRVAQQAGENTGAPSSHRALSVRAERPRMEI